MAEEQGWGGGAELGRALGAPTLLGPPVQNVLAASQPTGGIRLMDLESRLDCRGKFAVNKEVCAIRHSDLRAEHHAVSKMLPSSRLHSETCWARCPGKE